MPFLGAREAQASIFSSFLGNEALADINTNLVQNNNSQTMALLQANVSSLPALSSGNNTISDNATISIVSDNALFPTTNHVEISGEFGDGESGFDQTTIYVVRKGDTILEIANMFEVSVSTILSANNMKKGESVKEGDVLLILPFSGIEHTITKGQTLKGIASLYKVDLNEILLTNDIDISTNLVVGDKLIIPGAELSDEPTTIKPKTKTTVNTKGKVIQSLPSVSGYFKNPVPGARRTRGITGSHRGVDLAAPAGTPIHAAASGTVLAARMGYNGGFGNMVIIQHSNGSKTLYAHMTKLGTSTGAQVSQGEVIGYVGNTGSSRGNHLHIEVLGAKNPF